MSLWIVAAIAAPPALWGLHRLLLYMEFRGWIYYRGRGGGNAAGNAMHELQALFQPGASQVREATQTRRAGKRKEQASGQEPT